MEKKSESKIVVINSGCKESKASSSTNTDRPIKNTNDSIVVKRIPLTIKFD